MAVKRKTYDWEAIEREYRANQLSIREVAKHHGCSEGAIRKKAKAGGWERDLSKKIKEKVRSKLVRNEIVRKSMPVRTAAHQAAMDEEIVEEFSDRAVAVIHLHQKRINGHAKVGQMLLDELEALTCNKDDFVELAEALLLLDENSDADLLSLKSKLEAIQKVLSLPERSAVYLKLCTSLSKLIPLERQSYNLDDDDKGSGILDSLDEILKNVAGATRGLPNRHQTKIEG